MKDAREIFRWTSRQKELVEALWQMLDIDADNDNAQREAQLEVLLNLLVSFFFTLTGDKPFSSGLVHFLAVLGIDSDTNRLRTAKNYSYMLAGVVYCMRVLSVEHLLPSASRDEQTDEDRERFLQHREKYLADGSYSPMSWAELSRSYKCAACSIVGEGNNSSTLECGASLHTPQQDLILSFATDPRHGQTTNPEICECGCCTLAELSLYFLIPQIYIVSLVHTVAIQKTQTSYVGRLLTIDFDF
jgi:hypothetical protein